jgi:hypothetical protein
VAQSSRLAIKTAVEAQDVTCLCRLSKGSKSVANAVRRSVSGDAVSKTCDRHSVVRSDYDLAEPTGHVEMEAATAATTVVVEVRRPPYGRSPSPRGVVAQSSRLAIGEAAGARRLTSVVAHQNNRSPGSESGGAVSLTLDWLMVVRSDRHQVEDDSRGRQLRWHSTSRTFGGRTSLFEWFLEFSSSSTTRRGRFVDRNLLPGGLVAQPSDSRSRRLQEHGILRAVVDRQNDRSPSLSEWWCSLDDSRSATGGRVRRRCGQCQWTGGILDVLRRR